MKNNLKRIITILPLIGILILGVIACGCMEQKTMNIQNDEKTTAEKTTQNFVTITDATGKEVKIKEPVEKVITVYGLSPSFIYLLGEGGKYYAGWMWGTKFYKLVDPKAEEKANNGRTLNVEEIKKEDPNFVIAAYWQANKKDVNQLESLGVPVVCIKVESIDDIYSTIKTLGKVFQKEDYANEIINYYKTNAEDIEKRISKTKEKPKVLIIYYSGKAKAYKTFGGDMFQSKLVEMAGGESVSKDLSGKKTINVEQVANWNPDVILIIQYGKSAGKVKENILNDPAWSKINAVKNKKVYVVPNDGENWIDPCPKWILGLYWTAKVLHPEEFKDLNIKTKADEFYKKFFGLSVDKVNITGKLD
ncbi:ABC transporter substrate-binding protein [Methanotorris formicicus]|nr:ABC transporter substrate-binding protein [Methanotorris formicicus]